MIPIGPSKKLTIYVDETDKIGSKPVYEVLMELFYKKGIAGASVFRGVAGYGGDGVIHKAKLVELSTALPIKIEVVDTAEKISMILPLAEEVVTQGLIEVSDTNVVKCCNKKGT
jgi:PII-like signaling protein